jgi:GTP-binding protein HflX
LDLDIDMDVDNGRLLAFLAANGEILSKQYHDERAVIHCRIPRKHLGRIQEEAATVRIHRNRATDNDEEQLLLPGRAEDVA